MNMIALLIGYLIGATVVAPLILLFFGEEIFAFGDKWMDKFDAWKRTWKNK